MKVIIAGGRKFNDYNLLKKSLNNILKNSSDIEVVSGKAYGADQLGERYANQYGYKLTQFSANWSLYGKSAGYQRNKQMAEYATHLVAFWDGKSRGTKHMIDLATEYCLKIRTIIY